MPLLPLSPSSARFGGSLQTSLSACRFSLAVDPALHAATGLPLPDWRRRGEEEGAGEADRDGNGLPKAGRQWHVGAGQ